MLTLENKQYTPAVIPQHPNNPSLPLHIIMALFVQLSLKTVNGYLKLSFKK
jgi:hypothetical protein